MELIGILALQAAALFAMFGLPAIRDKIHDHAPRRRRRSRLSCFRVLKSTTLWRSRSCLTAQSLL